MKKLEIGCGGRPTPTFLHQDVTSVEGAKLDFQCMPYEINEDNFDLIIAVGVMEHMRFDEFRKTLAHFLKILKPGGEFSFDVPDLKAWCQYYIDSCEGKETPFEHQHILNTIYGWQRWAGDEHKSGWSKKTLDELINSLSYKNYSFEIHYSNPEIFEKHGIERNRFNRIHDKHLYVKLIKKGNMDDNYKDTV